MNARIKRIAKQSTKWTAIILAALIIVGIAYQQIGLAEDAALAPPTNQMVSVNGHEMHIVCMGHGPQTFVLDAGHASWSFAWWAVQPRLAKIGRVCAFDRAGLGWSDLGPGGFGGIGAANRLATLLRAARIRTPFIYVGHSLGANFGMIFAARYPKEVSALVLVEPADPARLIRGFHGTRTAALNEADCRTACMAFVAASHLGITRFLMRNAGATKLPQAQAADFRAGFGRPRTVYAEASTWSAFAKIGYQTRDVKTLGGLPVLLLTSAASNGLSAAFVSDLRKLTTDFTGPLEIPGSNHVSIVGRAGPSKITVTKIVAFATATPGWVAASRRQH